jgi:hypothetical protein
MTKRTREADGRLEAGLDRLREVPARNPKLVEKGRRLFLLEAKAIRGNLPAPLIHRLTKWIDGFLPQEIVFGNWRFASITALVPIAMVVTLLFGTAVATAYASRGALPGGTLYSVKTGLESAQLTLSSDASRETRLHLTFAEKRLDELAAVIERGWTEPASSLVERFEAQIGAAIENLDAVAARNPVEAKALTAEVMEALSRYSQILDELYAIVPDSVQPAVARALEASQPGSHLPKVDLLGSVVSVGDPDPQDGEAIWEINLGHGGRVVSVIVTEQAFIADGVAVGDQVKVEAFIVDDTFVAVEIHPAGQGR